MYWKYNNSYGGVNKKKKILYKSRGYYKPYYNNNYSNGVSTNWVAKQALRTANFVKSVVNPELKSCDFFINPGTSMGGTIVIQNVSSIQQGDFTYQRQGNSIRVKSLAFNCVLAANPSENRTVLVRCAIVVDTQNQGIAPGFTDIFDNVSTAGTNGTAVISAPLDVYSYPGRFKILYEGRTNLAPGATYSFSDNNLTWIRSTIYRKLDMLIKYDGQATTGVRSNAIYIVFGVAGNTAATYPLYDYNVRLRYYDN